MFIPWNYGILAICIFVYRLECKLFRRQNC